MSKFIFVGLGNPGERYAQTRHNAGWLFLDRLVERWSELPDTQWRMEKKLESSTFKCQHRSHELVLLKPQTFMNETGRAVRAATQWFPNATLVVVMDDLDIPLGKSKVQWASGPKDHNGLNNIRDQLGTSDFWVVRLGVDSRGPVRAIPGDQYVLLPMTQEDRQVLQTVTDNVLLELEHIVLE